MVIYVSIHSFSITYSLFIEFMFKVEKQAITAVPILSRRYTIALVKSSLTAVPCSCRDD